MPTASASIEFNEPIAKREWYIETYVAMARHAQGRSFADWPGWSTGETVIVALILNRHDVLHAMRFTMIEAFERNDLFSTAELRAIARRV